MSSLSTEFKTHMVDIVRDTMDYREKNNISRNDFIQILMELRKTDQIKGEECVNNGEKVDDSVNELFSLEQCAAQVAIFYLAGFDTTASAIANCLYELCRNPDLKDRLHKEIDEVLGKHDNIVSYESINEMKFLDCCVLGKSRYKKKPFIYFQNPNRSINFNSNSFFYRFRNFTKISNSSISQSNLHQRLSNTKYRFNHYRRNSNNYFTFGFNA